MDSSFQAATLVELLRWRAAKEPEALAYVFLKDGLTPEQELTYGALDLQVRALAGWLQANVQAGDRALLLYSRGLDVVVAFWACLYAGVIAIPAPPPDPARLTQSGLRLNGILQDSQPVIVLASADVAAVLNTNRAELALSTAVPCVDTATIDLSRNDLWVEYSPAPTSLAYLQYTSGSTSAPKGVMVTHGNMGAQAALVAEASRAGQASRWLTWLPYFHDYGLVHGVIVPVAVGSVSYLFSPFTFLRRPLRWLEAVSRHKITHSGAPNFAYDLCVRAFAGESVSGLDLSSWQVASCGAEPIRETTMAAFAAQCGPLGLADMALSPAYGMAEFTLLVSLKKPGRLRSVRRLQAAALENGTVVSEESEGGGRAVVGCGLPAGDTRVFVVDPITRLACPPDRVGEIWIAGRSAAVGYWGKPEETEQTFGAVLADSEEGPFLRTGDLGFLHDGEIYITGRCKDLIIIRGRNLYPQDIERTVETAHTLARVSGGVAFSVDQGRGEELVVVQELDRSARQGDFEEVVASIRQSIAEQHDVFAAHVVLVKAGTVPKTSSGKVQRQACRAAFVKGSLPVMLLCSKVPPGPQGQSVEISGQESLGAMTDLTRQDIAGFVQSVLAEQIGMSPGDIEESIPIARLGLDSLMINIIRNRLEDKFGVSPSFSQLLNGWSLQDVVAYIGDSCLTPRREQSAVVPAAAPTKGKDRVGSPSSHPLSKAQERLWFLEQIRPGTSINHLSLGICLRGELRVPALRQSLERLVQRYEILRARFLTVGHRVVAEIDAGLTYEFAVVDLRAMGDASRELELRRIIQQEAERPFSLDQGPLFRAALIMVGPSEHRLLLTFHRLIADGWSIRLFCRYLGRFYEEGCRNSVFVVEDQRKGSPASSVCEQAAMDSRLRESQLSYWGHQLKNPPAPVTVPTDYPRSCGGNFKGKIQADVLPAELVAEMNQVCREHNVTRFMVLYAALAVWLSRWTGFSDSIVGSVVANRRRVELEDEFGYLVNTVALRLDLSRTPVVQDVWREARRVVSEAYDHQDVAFEEVVESLNLKRDGGLSPLFKAMIVLDDDPLTDLRLPALEISRLPLEVNAAEFDLVLMVLNGAQGCELALVYDSDLYAPATAQRMVAQIQMVLREMLSQPDALWKRVLLMPEDERRLVVDHWNRTEVAIANPICLHRLIDLQASRVPDHPAVICGETSLAYRELAKQSDRIAKALRELGVVHGDRVGLCMDRSVDGIVGLLGILKAGAAYVPLDPTVPEQRLRFMLDDARVALVLTQAPYESRIGGFGRIGLTIARCLSQEMATLEAPGLPEVSLAAAAYVIYTSGSTGQPKGVEVTHHALAYSMDARARYYADPVERCLLTFSYAFDGSVTGIFWTLLQGGSLVIPAESVHRDPRELAHLIQRYQISHVVWVPSLYEAILREVSGSALNSLRVVISAGERLPVTLVHEHYARVPGAVLYNEYGPTEATVWSAVYRTSSDEPGRKVSIGHPIANVQLYVLDDLMQPVPIGAEGELCIGGACLARGYLNRPEVTRERFVPHPFLPESRVYRTGDIVRRTADGNLEFVGRVDHQVKLRGYRIELGEIESVLSAYPGIAQTAVILREDRPGHPALVAYLQGAREDRTDEQVRAHLAAQLPASMVPTQFVWLSAMPTTVGGKLDRQALPAPVVMDGNEGGENTPQTPVEAGLAEIWKEVLQVREVSRGQNFFHLGGHSLLVTQVAARIRERFHMEMPLRTFFDRPVLSDIAEVIAASQREGATGAKLPPMVSGSRESPLPLSFSQQRMWFMHCLDPAGTAYNMPLRS